MSVDFLRADHNQWRWMYQARNVEVFQNWYAQRKAYLYQQRAHSAYRAVVLQAAPLPDDDPTRNPRNWLSLAEGILNFLDRDEGAFLDIDKLAVEARALLNEYSPLWEGLEYHGLITRVTAAKQALDLKFKVFEVDAFNGDGEIYRTQIDPVDDLRRLMDLRRRAQLPPPAAATLLWSADQLEQQFNNSMTADAYEAFGRMQAATPVYANYTVQTQSPTPPTPTQPTPTQQNSTPFDPMSFLAP